MANDQARYQVYDDLFTELIGRFADKESAVERAQAEATRRGYPIGVLDLVTDEGEFIKPVKK